MIHPACKTSNMHNWTAWEWKICYADGTTVGVYPDGSYTIEVDRPQPLYFYRRSCHNMGCDAVELAESLEPAGDHTVIDVGGSEILYRPKE